MSESVTNRHHLDFKDSTVSLAIAIHAVEAPSVKSAVILSAAKGPVVVVVVPL
jgi:hypothetical protein